MSFRADLDSISQLSEKECSKRRSRETQKSSSSTSGRTLKKTESTEIVLLNESFRNTRSSLMSTDSRTPSTSGITFEEMGKKGKLSDVTMKDSAALLSSMETNKSKIPRITKIKTHSDNSIERPTERLFLKKTEETINFSFEDVNPDRMDNSSVRCEAERLNLGDERKSSGEVTARSDTILTESLFGDICLDSQGAFASDELVRYEQMSQPSIPFQSYENVNRTNDLGTTVKIRKKLQSLWSNADFLSKPQIVGFLTKLKTKRLQKKKEEEDPDLFSRIYYLDPPVPELEDMETKEYLRHFFFHVLQLIFITSIAMGMVSSSMFYFSDITSKLFTDTATYPKVDFTPPGYSGTLKDVMTLGDIWAYLETTLIKLLFWDFAYYNAGPEGKGDKKMYGDNQVLGTARIRQVRVKSDSCKIHPNVMRFFDSCYDYYSVFSESNAAIREDMNGSLTSTAWIYTNAKDLHSTPHWGEISIYGGGGYYLDLPLEEEMAVKAIQELKMKFWLTRATRALFIDFNIYNANVNLFCICRIIVEFPPVGGLISTTDFQSLKLIRYLNISDFIILGIEILYILFVVFCTWEVSKKIVKQRSVFLTKGWNYLNLTILLFSYIYIIVSIALYILSTTRLPNLEKTEEFVDLTEIKNLQIFYNNIIAGLVFFCWVKLFMFFNFTKTLEEFRRCLKMSLREILTFLPIFLTMFLSFTFLAHLLFGNQLKEYCTIVQAFLSLLQAFLGGFSYHQITDANRLLGPIFFAAYIFFMFFVLMNVFIAIFNNSYLVVKSQVIPSLPRSGDYIRRAVVNFMSCCHPRKKKKSFSKSLRKQMFFDDLKKTMIGAGFKEEEIEIFFHKFKINYRNILEAETKSRVLKDLELKRIHYSENSEQFQINLLRRRLDDYRKRMDEWEMKMQPLIDKVDVIVKRFSS